MTLVKYPPGYEDKSAAGTLDGPDIPTNLEAGYPIANALNCPHCGGQYLHHESVSVYVGASEDSKQLRLTEVSGAVGVLSVNRRPYHGRRDSCFIRFGCEECEARPILRVLQHKGGSFIEWMPAGPALSDWL